MISDTAYQAYEKKLLKDILKNPVPKHIAIIMDGNRRFAELQGLKTVEGHLKGKDKLEEVMDWCLEVGVRILTVYAFSTENLNRDKKEVDVLMKLFAENFRKAGDDERAHKHKIRVKVLGNIKLLPKDVQSAIKYAEGKTKDYDQYFYNIAVAYGSREEIIQAIRNIAKDVKDGKLNIDDIDEKVFASKLYTGDIPDPDLVLEDLGGGEALELPSMAAGVL